MDQNQDDDLDVLGLLVRMKDCVVSFFSSLAAFFGYLLRLALFRWYAVLLLLALSVACGVFFTSGNRMVYSGTLSLRLNAGDSYMASEMVNEMQHFVSNDDFDGLSECLYIPKEKAKAIVSIKPVFFIGFNKDSIHAFMDSKHEFEVSDTTVFTLKNRLAIELRLRNRSLFPDVQNAIVDFFCVNEYMANEYNIRVNSLYKNLDVINCDLLRLDSLQKLQFFRDSKPELYLTSVTSLKAGKQDLYYQDKLALLSKRKLVEDNLIGADDVVTVISPFHPGSVDYRGWICMAAKFFAVFFCLLLVALVVLDNRRNISAFINKK